MSYNNDPSLPSRIQPGRDVVHLVKVDWLFPSHVITPRGLSPRHDSTRRNSSAFLKIFRTHTKNLILNKDNVIHEIQLDQC